MPQPTDSEKKGSDAFPSWDFGAKPPAQTNPSPAAPTSEPAGDEIADPSEPDGLGADRPLQTATGKIHDHKLWWKTLMSTVAEKRVTDIIFNPESHDCFIRVNMDLELYQRIGKPDYDNVILHLVPKEKREELMAKGESDFAVTCFGRRMRVNVFKTLKGMSGAFRPLPNKSIPWKDNGLTDPMMNIIENTKQGLVLVTGPTGSGKCWGKGTELIMFDGSIKKAEEILPGELLMGPDSKPRKVLSTTKGKGPLYQIEPVKGKPWVCNDVHVMTLKRSVKGQQIRPDGRKRNDGEYQAFGKTFPAGPGKKRDTPPQEIVDVPLNEFLSRTSSKTPVSQYWKLFRTGVEFPTCEEIAAIDAAHFYYLGLWLGDGSKNSNNITNIDTAIIDWVAEYGAQPGFRSRNNGYNPKSPETRRVGASQNIGRAKKRNGEFPFIIGTNGENFCLKTFLGCCLETPKGIKAPTLKHGEGPKVIPLWVKTSTRPQRLAVLAGLMDTDGSLGTNCFDFTNEEKNLVEGVAFIARSLGLWASPPKEKVIKGNTYWRICISGNTDMVPTTILRKQATARTQKKDALVTGWDANPIGEGEYFGFELDGDGRCLLSDFTVTHNSTTICSMLEYLNEKYAYHIISIEDPIEYIFQNKKSVLSQREVGEHTGSFQSALRASLRENPDIIFVGEMRDYETAKTALMAADTGHLVFGTLHTRRAYTTISRLLEMAPESSRPEMRAMLSNALAMVVCQRLLQKKGGGIWPCREVMMLNPAISSLIKEGKEKGISNQLVINQAKGMVEWGKALETAERSGLITPEEAEKYRDSTEDID